MTKLFQELDYCETHIGALSLRRRMYPAHDGYVYEVKVDGEFLMSSLFTAGEIALAELALAELALTETDGDGISVAVAGLGLGYTANAVLQNPGVASLVVIDALPSVIDWHRRGLVPLGKQIADDPRCHLVHGDFFAMVGAGGQNLDPRSPDARFDAILVDVDHSPRNLLSPGHAGFYQTEGLRRLAAHLKPGGVFALWSNDPPDRDFQSRLGDVFPQTAAQIVSFPNPARGEEEANTIYIARMNA